MRVNKAHLTYCLNVHPGEGYADIKESILEYVLDIQKVCCPHKPFGLGLRIAHSASLELSDPDTLQDFKHFLDTHNLYCFTVNAFPYGNFHNTPVKESVYLPNWDTRERLEYTIRVAQILATLLPDGHTGSISTSPLSYKGLSSEESCIPLLLELVQNIKTLRHQTNKTIMVAIEPEPDCTLETTDEFIRFYHLLLEEAQRRGILKSDVQRHLGICFDTCHAALQFEDITKSITSLYRENIPIAKIQLSSALKVTPSAPALLALKDYCDPVYLHQVKALLSDGSIQGYPDLPLALSSNIATTTEARIHFHLPLYFAGNDTLQTTAEMLSPTFLHKAQEYGVDHFEIETYTFNVLPKDLQKQGLTQSIINEYRFIQERF